MATGSNVASPAHATNTVLSDFGVHPILLSNLSRSGISDAQKVQTRMFDAIRKHPDDDFIFLTPIGSGKSIGAMLLLLDMYFHMSDELRTSNLNRVLDGDHLTNGRHYPQAIILTPTREMAITAFMIVNGLLERTRTTCSSVYGGCPYDLQMNALKQGCDIITGTLGRLLHFMRNGIIDLSHVKMLVLDDADWLVTDFQPDLDEFFSNDTLNRRTCKKFFITSHKSMQHEALYARYSGGVSGWIYPMDRRSNMFLNINEHWYTVQDGEKLQKLVEILEQDNGPIDTSQQYIIFCNKKSTVKLVYNHLLKRGKRYESMYMFTSKITQLERERRIQEFKKGTLRILCASPIISRGGNYKHCHQVIHYDLPNHLHNLQCSSGRVGRNGRLGTVVNFLDPTEHAYLESYRQEFSYNGYDTSTLLDGSPVRRGDWRDIQSDIDGIIDQRRTGWSGRKSKSGVHLTDMGPGVLATGWADSGVETAEDVQGFQEEPLGAAAADIDW